MLSGGIILNITTSIIAILIINYIPLNEIIYIFLLVFIAIGFYLGILNVLPLKKSISTDGCELMGLSKNKQARECYYNFYMVDLSYLKDIKLKNILQTTFNMPEDANWNNPIFAAMKNHEADRYFDNMKYEKAEETYKS